MRQSLLKDLACPSALTGKRCLGTLKLTLSPEPRFDPQDSDELIEARLECDTCGASYPVLCGVAILVPEPTPYLQRHYKTILGLALESELGLSPAMRTHLHTIGAHIESENGVRPGEDTARALSNYLHAHYDQQSIPLERLPANHPLAAFLRACQGNDLYYTLIEMLKPALRPGGKAIDIGCHVGRLTRDLAELGQHTIGVDLSFSAVFLARRAVRGWPSQLGEYEVFRDNLARETRLLNLPPLENGEVIVASALQLPFPAESFDLAVSANVIDILPDPIALLREMRFLLHPEGLMAISTPYHTGAGKAVGRWLGTQNRMSVAQTLRWRIGHHFEILSEQDNIPWVLGEHERHIQIYLNHCMLGRKSPKKETK